MSEKWVAVNPGAPMFTAKDLAAAEERGRRAGIEELQSRVGRWVRLAFTDGALTDRWERVARVVEEAIELAQAEGLDHEDVYRIWQRVYSRGKGDPQQEAGGIMVCLLAWAEGRETSLAACALREIERIEAPGAIEKIRRKQSEKVACGTGRDYARIDAALAPRDSGKEPDFLAAMDEVRDDLKRKGVRVNTVEMLTELYEGRGHSHEEALRMARGEPDPGDRK